MIPQSTFTGIIGCGFLIQGIYLWILRNENLEVRKANLKIQRENADIQTKYSDIQRENAHIQRENADIQRENADIQTKNSDIQRENADIQKENADIQKKYSETKERLSKVEREISYMKARDAINIAMDILILKHYTGPARKKRILKFSSVDVSTLPDEDARVHAQLENLLKIRDAGNEFAHSLTGLLSEFADTQNRELLNSAKSMARSPSGNLDAELELLFDYMESNPNELESVCKFAEQLRSGNTTPTLTQE